MPSGPVVLVLGATGMLGSTVLHRLRARFPGWRVDGSGRGRDARPSLDAEAGRPGIGELFRLASYTHVVNCIGVLRQAIDENRADSLERAVRTNALFPHELADVAGQHDARVVHISTDAVFSGRHQQPYAEDAAPDPVDAYGASKLLGESPADNVINLRCSIVGRDHRRRGLVEWYLGSTAATVTGFVDYVWTPATTVQVADWCGAAIDGGFDTARAGGHVFHFAPNPPLSKADFLQCIRDQVGAGPTIQRAPGAQPCVRILAMRGAPGLIDAGGGWPAPIREMMTEFSSRGV